MSDFSIECDFLSDIKLWIIAIDSKVTLDISEVDSAEILSSINFNVAHLASGQSPSNVQMLTELLTQVILA